MSDDAQACAECQSYRAGHNVHFIQARLTGQAPWGWRDATVTAIDGLTVNLAYVEAGTEIRLWHHRDLSSVLRIGSPVRLHEQYHVLGTPVGWLCVELLEGRLGAVPEPVDVEAWRSQQTPGVVNLQTGLAVPTDHAKGPPRSEDR